MIEIDDTLRTLWTLVHEGALTPIMAVREWVKETGNGFSFAIQNGVLVYFETATK